MLTVVKWPLSPLRPFRTCEIVSDCVGRRVRDRVQNEKEQVQRKNYNCKEKIHETNSSGSGGPNKNSVN